MLPHNADIIFFLHRTAITGIYTLSLHDALPIFHRASPRVRLCDHGKQGRRRRSDAGPERVEPRWTRPHRQRSEEHTSELQSRRDLVCRLLLEKKKTLGGVMTKLIKRNTTIPTSK